MRTWRVFSAICLQVLVASLVVPPLVAQSTRAVDAAVEAGIRQRTYPGAVVVIGRSDTILYSKGYGSYTWRGDTRRPDPAWSLWDVASLSKVVATASAVAVLVDRHQLDLDRPVRELVPRYSGEVKDHVTVRMLLDHTSGLPAWAALGGSDNNTESAWTRVFDIAPRRKPGEVPLYSDINAIIAGYLVERATGTSLEQFTRDSVFAPSGMLSATWKPTASDRLRTVPSELRADGSTLAGRVHDPNAQALGGVAGHAGVFATGTDLAHFAQKWLRGLRGTDSTWLSPNTYSLFAQRGPSTGTRALGWDTPTLSPPDGKPPLYGACATESTLGHTGFTGTMLWLDPEQDLFVVFLTNRSYQPTRYSSNEMRMHRAAVSDAARRMVGRC
jgi:CubicO group peptidase (beta-lactamase class C family)